MKISENPRNSGHVAGMAAMKMLAEIGNEDSCDVPKNH
jgi:hypothetical protein